jgi:hypothetical protein
MKSRRFALISVFVTLLVGAATAFSAENTDAVRVNVDRILTMNNGSLELAYDTEKGTFSVQIPRLGTVLRGGEAIVNVGGRAVSSADESYDFSEASAEKRGEATRVSIVQRSPQLPTIVVSFEMSPSSAGESDVTPQGLKWFIEAKGPVASPRITAELVADEAAFVCRPNAPAGGPDEILPVAIGRPGSALYTGIFDRRRDFATELRGDKVNVSPGLPEGEERSFSCSVLGPAGELLCYPDFLKRFRNLPYYEPFPDKPWPRGVSGYCSWYFYYVDVSEQDMVKETDWMAEHLKPYGLEYILMDDGWQTDVWTTANEKFPHGLRWLNDHIHSRGLKTALWLTPFALSSDEILREHPDWFVKDAEGKYVSTFKGKYCVDPTHPEVLNYLREMAKTLKGWDYDYVKLDGLPAAEVNFATHRTRLHDPTVSGATALRQGLQAVRDGFGPEGLMNGCWGTPTDAFGILNSSRIGGDVGAPRWDHVLGNTSQICQWMFIHNLAWVNDPDCSCVRPPLTLEQSRARVSAFALTGGVFLGSDQMFTLPEERVDVFRRALPVADVWPRDLWAKPHVNVWDLRIEKPWGCWDVVGLFNWTVKKTTRKLAFEEIGLSPEERYMLYDYWDESFLGPVAGSYSTELSPTSCRVFSVHALKDRPFLISTSRHVTQGAVDLLSMSWDADALRLSGRSLVVKGDPYVLRIVMPPQPVSYRFAGARAAGCAVTSDTRGPWLSVTLLPAADGEANWEVDFHSQPAEVAPPSPPSDVTAGVVTERAVELSWSGDSETAVGYAVFRDGERVATVSRTAYHDLGLSPNTAYRYRIASLDWSGDLYPSAESIQVRTKTPPPRPPRPQVSITELKPISAEQGWGSLRTNTNCTGLPITIDGEVFEKGLGTHAASKIVYKLQPRFTRFVAICGLDNSAGLNGSIRFRVELDGKELFASPVLTSEERKAYVDVPVRGGDRLTLYVDDGGDGIDYDHADWAEAGFLYGESKQ